MALYALDGFERCVPHLADSSLTNEVGALFMLIQDKLFCACGTEEQMSV